MSKLDIIAMFFFSHALALWGMWSIPSMTVEGQAAMLSFITIELICIGVWLTMTFVIGPAVTWATNKAWKRFHG